MQNTNTFRLDGALLDKTVLDNLNIGNGIGVHIKDTLNTLLKSELSSTFTETGYTVMPGLIHNMDHVDIAAKRYFKASIHGTSS